MNTVAYYRIGCTYTDTEVIYPLDSEVRRIHVIPANVFNEEADKIDSNELLVTALEIVNRLTLRSGWEIPEDLKVHYVEMIEENGKVH